MINKTDRYTFLKAVVIEKKDKVTDKAATPMIGYLIHDSLKNKDKVYSRHEAYDMIAEFGATNVEPKMRLDDGAVVRYYLKLKDKSHKINEYLVNYKELNEEDFTLSFQAALQSALEQ